VSADQVGAVVVSYNAAAHLEVCLASLGAEGVVATVVVDNGSTDGSREVALAAGAAWLETGANVGYGRAANAGAGHPSLAGLPWLLVCNPDVEVMPGSVATLVSTLQSDEALGVVGPRISNTDGSLYPSARVFPDLLEAAGHGLLGLVAPRNRFTRRYRLLDWDHSGLSRVDWVSGACFIARRRAWDEVGGFDPRYFMYLEDVDLCWRLARAGWSVAYQPAAEVVHVQGVSADRHPYRMLVAHHRSMWIFARRTASGRRRLLLPAVLAGLAVRLAATVARRAAAGRAGARPAAN